MDNNQNFNQTQRDPLPQYQPPVESITASADAPFHAVPAYVPTPQPQKPVIPQQLIDTVESLASSAFGKGLAGTIIAHVPIASIVSIFLSASALSKSKKASEIGNQYGFKAPGKNIAARVLSIIGLAQSIFFTFLWSIYFFTVVAVISAAIMS